MSAGVLALGRASSIGARVRVREALAAAALVGVGLGVLAEIDAGAGRTSWYAVALVALAVMAGSDLRTRRVPNTLVYPALLLAAVVPAAFGVRELVVALEGGAIGFGVMLALALIGRGAMGMADVKVMTFCGLLLGPGVAVTALVLAFTVGAVVALLLVVVRAARRDDSLPLVPFLAGAAAPLLLAVGGAV